MTDETNATQRLAAVQRRIAAAEERASRDKGSTQLVAVSKTFSADEIRPVLDAGQRVFGENRVQEARAKWPGLREAYGDIELHLLGPLQSNKAAEAVALFDVIESVDRERIATELGRAMQRQGKQVPVYVQVNIGEEPQKAGVAPNETLDFVTRCREVHGLEVLGLMCIPPVDDDPAPHFAALRELGKKAGLPKLSMGMSGDFEMAIAEGATSVRVGSAIFGSRG